MMGTINGFLREDGSMGVRNRLLVMASVSCANDTVQKIARRLPGAVSITHQHGCGHLWEEDIAQTRRTLVGNACNPNVAACLVVGLGCELLDSSELAQEIRMKSGKSVANVCIQSEGGTIGAVAKGVRVGQELLERIAEENSRVACPLSSLTVGIAGNSDEGTQGSALFVGALTDLLLEKGVTVIQGETAELLGAEAEALSQCAPRAREGLSAAFARVREKLRRMKTEYRDIFPRDPSEEKRRRMGTGVFREVAPYGEVPREKGLIHMESTRFTPEVISGMTAAGCQIIFLVAGGKGCMGSPVAPVIRLAPEELVRSRLSPESVFEELVAVVEGWSPAPAEECLNTFAITRIGPST